MSDKGAASGAASGKALSAGGAHLLDDADETALLPRSGRWQALRLAGDVLPEGFALGAGLGARGLHLGADAVGAGDVQAGARPTVTMAMVSWLSLNMAGSLRMAGVA